jgi:hypothetical protein
VTATSGTAAISARSSMAEVLMFMAMPRAGIHEKPGEGSEQIGLAFRKCRSPISPIFDRQQATA